MSRFIVNRRWAFILALQLALASCFALSSPVRAEGPPTTEDVPITDIGGDPDGPGLGGKGGLKGAGQVGGMAIESYTAGDGVASEGAWIWRFRAVVLSLRGLTFRF